jgi:predicted nucleotidyltransferase
MWKRIFDEVVDGACRAAVAHYGERLVSLAVFGSVARGTPKPESDIDLLLVADPLPQGRMARVREFEAVDRELSPALERARRQGIHTTLSPVLKTPTEVEAGSLLFLDMIEEARILVDRGDFLRGFLDGFAFRLGELGAKRVRKGAGYYWILKPDLRPGEEITL